MPLTIVLELSTAAAAGVLLLSFDEGWLSMPLAMLMCVPFAAVAAVVSFGDHIHCCHCRRRRR